MHNPKKYLQFYPVKALKKFYDNGEITKDEYNSLVTSKYRISCEVFGCHYYDKGRCQYDGNCPHRT